MNTKLLEIIGFALVCGMIYAMFGGGETGPIWIYFFGHVQLELLRSMYTVGK